LGDFDTAKEAALGYDKSSRKAEGAKAKCNFEEDGKTRTEHRPRVRGKPGARGAAVKAAPVAMKKAAPAPAPAPGGAKKKGKEALLEWVKDRTSVYANVKVTNLTTCWLDGMAFCALIHRRNAAAIPQFGALDPANAAENLELAFGIAEKKFKIERLVDVEYLSKKHAEGKRPDAKVMQMVLAEWFKAMR
jgi:hypothetical protein